MKIVTWNFHIDDSQENARYGIIIGWGLLSEIQIYLCISYFTIIGNEGAYEGCIASVRDINNGYERITTGHLDDASFRDK